MPLAPSKPDLHPHRRTYSVPLAAVATAGNDLTTAGVVVEATGYIRSAKLIPVGAAAFHAANNRTWALVSPSTRVVTDGVTTNLSKTLTSATAAFTDDDKDKAISGTGIPASTTIAKIVNATTVELSAAATATGTGVSVTIGASRTLATFTSSAVSLAADTPQTLVLDSADTKVYKGDVLKVTSVHNASGVADPGGVLQLEVVSYGEGTG